MIRIFGNLWLPGPEQALPAQELLHTKRLLAIIRAFEERQAEEARAQKSNGRFFRRQGIFISHVPRKFEHISKSK